MVENGYYEVAFGLTWGIQECMHGPHTLRDPTRGFYSVPRHSSALKILRCWGSYLSLNAPHTIRWRAEVDSVKKPHELLKAISNNAFLAMGKSLDRLLQASTTC